MSDLHVGICGAGIGGVAAAIALRRAGVKVTVLEAAAELGEIGAGIQVRPYQAPLHEPNNIDDTQCGKTTHQMGS